MIWFLLALGSGLSKALVDLTGKRVVGKMSEIQTACVASGLSGLLAAGVVAWQGIPTIGSGFLRALILSGMISVAGLFLTLRALKIGELSIVAPLLATSPVFLLVTSPIMIGQFPSPAGTLGVLVAVFGLYFMKIKERQVGWLEPFRALWRGAGAKEALAVSFLYSLASNYDLVGIKNSSPFFFIMMIDFFICGIFFWPALVSKNFFSKIKENFKSLSLMSALSVGVLGFQYVAFSLALVPYVIAVKRTSVLFSVVLGKQFFKEKEFKNRLLGAAIMVAGLILIKLFG